MNHLMPGLRCDVEPDRERVVVRPVGEVDLATVGAVQTSLEELWANGFTEIVLDLRWVPFMDSCGLRMLIVHSRRAEQDGATLRIEIAEGGPVHRLLELTGTLDLLPISVGAPS